MPIADENESADLPSVPAAELRGHGDGPVNIVRFTADGKYCVTGANDRTARLWNPTRIDPAYRPPPPPPIQHRDPSLVSSQDYYGRSLSRPTEPPSALPMQSYRDGHLHPVRALATNSSSTVLLSASDRTLLATDLVTAQWKQKWWGHTARIEHVTALGGGGKDNGGGSGVEEEIYASASYDSTVRLWDARSRAKEPLMILDQAKDAVTCVEGGKGGEAQIVTSSVDGKIRTYDLRTAQLFAEDVVQPVTSFSLSNDGSSIAASCLDGIIRMWGRGPTDGQGKRIRKLHSSHKNNNYKVECAFSSDGEYIISGSECGAVAVYPLGSKGATDTTSSGEGRATKGKTLQRHTGPTCSIAACPQDSRPWLAVSASYDGTAVVWASQAQYDCCS